jgi:hypothetical protein
MATLIGGPSTFTLTSDQIPEGKGFNLGAIAESNTGIKYQYVQAGAAITQYDAVHIDETYTANPLTRALADDAGQIGVAQVAFASAARGWVAIGNGPVTVRAAASSSANAVLWTSDTAGVLQTTAATASHLPIFGLVAASAASAGGVTNVGAYAAYPAVRGTSA